MTEENIDLELQKSMDSVEKFLESEKSNESSPIEIQVESPEEIQEVVEDEPHEEVHREDPTSLDIDDDLQRQILAKKKLSKLTRERHRLAAETQKLKEENQALRNHMEHSSQAAMTHYDNNVQLRIDTAKKEKLKALEIGDMESVVERDQELAAAVAELNSIQSWKTQESIRQYNQQQESQQYQQQQQQQYYEPPETELNQETETWIEANPWFDPNSREHIPEVFEDVNDYVASLDEHLARTGKEHQRFTKAYFNKIDAYVNETYGRQAPLATAPIKMKSSNQYVEPVRNTRSIATPAQKQKVTLSPEEIDMARRSGVSDQEFIKHKLIDMEKQKMRGTSNGYR
jgi:hypothetical protein